MESVLYTSKVYGVVLNLNFVYIVPLIKETINRIAAVIYGHYLGVR